MDLSSNSQLRNTQDLDVRAFDLEEFLLGPVRYPQNYIEDRDEETSESIRTINDEYLNWKKIDQLLVGWIFSTLNDQFSHTSLKLTELHQLSLKGSVKKKPLKD
ncbi:hypothetical protein Ddye_013652 [Dipteronia dyeriana]|uniref:Uncharacterized protein n=1 Tax=Dipteronia dyeriana TaxID=168575 RepID=A0AAD9X6T2_9ROSI|nr:hypothetical protein Ddye_013652 [Dipteronia dyeriana]